MSLARMGSVNEMQEEWAAVNPPGLQPAKERKRKVFPQNKPETIRFRACSFIQTELQGTGKLLPLSLTVECTGMQCP